MSELPYTFQRDIKRVLKEVQHLEHLYRQDGRTEIHDALKQMRDSMADWPVKLSAPGADLSPGQQAAADAGSHGNVSAETQSQDDKYGRRADQSGDWKAATQKAVEYMANAVGQAAGDGGDGNSSGVSGT